MQLKSSYLCFKEGGTETRQNDPGSAKIQTLSDQQILQLAQIGRQIEAYFGCPQDIEWCLVDTFYIVQSRPITTLYPIQKKMMKSCVYISWSSTNDDRCDETTRIIFFLLTTNAPMRKAGGRLFVDATQQLALPASRDYLINTLGNRMRSKRCINDYNRAR